MQLYSLPSIDYLRLRFHLKALKDCDLPAWKGSLYRFLDVAKAKMKLSGFIKEILLQGDLAPFVYLLPYSEVFAPGNERTYWLIGIKVAE